MAEEIVENNAGNLESRVKSFINDGTVMDFSVSIDEKGTIEIDSDPFAPAFDAFSGMEVSGDGAYINLFGELGGPSLRNVNYKNGNIEGAEFIDSGGNTFYTYLKKQPDGKYTGTGVIDETYQEKNLDEDDAKARAEAIISHVNRSLNEVRNRPDALCMLKKATENLANHDSLDALTFESLAGDMEMQRLLGVESAEAAIETLGNIDHCVANIPVAGKVELPPLG